MANGTYRQLQFDDTVTGCVAGIARRPAPAPGPPASCGAGPLLSAYAIMVYATTTVLTNNHTP